MRSARRFGLFAAILLVGSLYVCPAAASESTLAKVPPNNFGCALCHAGSGVTVSSVPSEVAEELQPFGVDWASLAPSENGRSWADMVAESMDSDGDLCSNAYELGDPDGNYFEDQELESRDQDPNQKDCTLPLDEQSWGNLKALFEN